MKWSFAAFLTATSLSQASPIFPGPDLLPYRLRLQSGNKDLNGQFLSTNGTAVGVFGDVGKPLEVYTVTDKKTGLVELHTYPAGSESRLLALVGEPDGMLSLANLPDPESIQIEPGLTCDWKSFQLGGSSTPNPGRPGNSVTYVGAKGKWVGLPVPLSNDWTVSFKSAQAYSPSIDMPVDVVYVPIYEDGVVTIMN